MKKILSKLGLVGILSVGILGSSAYGLEINEKGFPVPDKTKAVYTGITMLKDASNRKIIGIFDVYEEGNKLIYEYSFNGKIGSYKVVDIDDPERNYLIQDTDCDGIFETKYDVGDGWVTVPDCYFE